MYKTFIFLFFILTVNFISAQNKDLIVTIDGDSLACKILDVNENEISLIMKYDNRDVETTISRDKITTYKYDVIQKDMYRYKSGTSYITSIKKNPGYSMYTNKKNSFYFQFVSFEFPSINYERIIPFADKAGITLGFGGILKQGERPFSRVNCGLIFGGPNHFVQPELSLVGFYSIIGLVNYKYQSNNGIYLKGGIAIGALLAPTIGVGYSF